MRNLKKVLSLVLALVMTLSLATAAFASTPPAPPAAATPATETTKTSAALDFTDADKIENVDAVALLNSLDVLVGYEDGSFAPEKTVTRAEAAKIICYLLLGADVASSLADASVETGFTDMEGAEWASGYVQYCATIGVINGYGDGRFGPQDAVTTYQFAKMLLCAIGYGVNDEYTGSTWATSVAVDAMKQGILTKGTTNEDCTRDMTALFAFNTLFVKQVVYTKDKATYSNKVDNVEIGALAATSFNLAQAESVLTYTKKTATEAAYYTVVDDKDTAATTDDVTVKLAGVIGDIGHTISVWYQNVGTTAKPVYETVTDYTITDKVVATVSDGTYLKNGGPDPVYTVSSSTAYYLNGSVSTASAVASAVGTKGVSVELISTDTTDKTIETVRVVVKSVAVVTGDYKTKEDKGETKVYVPTYTSALGTSSSYVSAVGYEKLKKDDVVLLETLADGAISITVASSIDGNITATGTDKGTPYVTVGGTNYFASALTGALSSTSGLNAVVFGTTAPSTTTYTFYKDDAGYVIGAIATDTAAASGNYMLVTDIAYIDAVVNGLNTAPASVQANVLKTDGTVATITLTTIKGYTPAKAVATTAADYTWNGTAWVAAAVQTAAQAAGGIYATDNAGTGAYISVSATTADNSDLTDTWYNYAKDSTGKYALTAVASPAATVAVDTAANSDTYYITSGIAKFDGVNIANSKTVFLVETLVSGKAVFTAYTGIANVPSVKTSVSGTAITVGGVCTFVYLNAGTVVSANLSQQVFITEATGSALVDSTLYYTYSAIVDGVEDVDLYVKTTADTLVAGTMYDLAMDGKFVDSVNKAYAAGTITTDATGAITSTTAAAGDYYVGVNSVAGGVISVGRAIINDGTGGTSAGLQTNAFTYDSSTAVSVISKDGPKYPLSTVAASGIDVDFNDYVYVVSKDGTYANEIIVIKQYSTPTLSALALDVNDVAQALNAAFASGTTSYTLALDDATITTKPLVINTADLVAGSNSTIQSVSVGGTAIAASNNAYTLVAAGTTTGTFVVTIVVGCDNTDVANSATTTYTITVTVA